MPVNDTIVALSTPAGESAIALIRLSGPACPDLGMAISGRSKPLKKRYAHLSHYQAIDGHKIDDCIITHFLNNESFTGESMLEIAAHGNPLIVQKILTDLLARGCRLAEPGEFTRTAFLNGRMDLSQAEAVSDLIRARSDHSLEVARRQLHGSVRRKMDELTQGLLSIMAHIEAYIDFPEEDLPNENHAGPVADLKELISEVKDLIQTQRYSALFHEGIKTLIVGEPNVGKSSLINILTGTERSIVSDIPGTTRDYISEFIMLGPWRIEILDTAGIHETADAIEKIGIHHTIEQAETADFFLFVLDATQPPPRTLPHSLFKKMTPKNTLVIENKIDQENTRSYSDFLPEFKHVPTSLIHNTGISALRRNWLESIDSNLTPPQPDDIIVNTRHATSLQKVLDALEPAFSKLKKRELPELVAADLREAIEQIGDVVGRVDNERMLDCLFKEFCIGK